VSRADGGGGIGIGIGIKQLDGEDQTEVEDRRNKGGRKREMRENS
jgi:hypothetical protein